MQFIKKKENGERENNFCNLKSKVHKYNISELYYRKKSIFSLFLKL